MTRTQDEKPLFEPGLIPAPGAVLDWRDGRHFDRWQDRPCVLCDKPTPIRSHYGEPVHKACAEDWIAAHPVEARLGRFASDVLPKRLEARLGRFASDVLPKRRHDDDYA